MGGRSSNKVVIPPQDSTTLFRMVDFKSTSDIKDKGPNSIGVTASGLSVGTDTFANYMNFDGNGFFKVASSALLNRTGIELRFIVDKIVLINASYGETIMDTRPTGDNGDGNYYLMGLDQGTTSPIKFYLVNPTSTSRFSNPVDITKGPMLLSIKLTSAGSTLSINGQVIINNPTNSALRTNNLRVGISAFSSAGVPNFRGRMYYMDIHTLS